MPKLKDIVNGFSKELIDICENPKKEVKTLLCASLDKDILWLMTHDNEDIDIPKDFLNNIEKRKKSIPLEYILNKASFFSSEFYVDDRVLIPRPETELLVEKVVNRCKDIEDITIAEIGTGSGIISIMLSLLLPKAQIIATDLSKEALEVAQINANKHGVNERIKFVNCNLLDDVHEHIDILVSNPPYIKDDEILDKNLSYEPNLALYGGVVGDEILKKIIDIAINKKVLLLACEMGYDQRDKISEYLHKFDLKAEFYRDYTGLDRGFLL
ncbi:MAG: peptide chain release factor N(5)-glutamine methyltransferase [Sulfurospirillaceae bacterium]|nr:peptide chain release factor N(5)-glutamine methyltransferase [Sulfurospirillaceae bacterium]